MATNDVAHRKAVYDNYIAYKNKSQAQYNTAYRNWQAAERAGDHEAAARYSAEVHQGAANVRHYQAQEATAYRSLQSAINPTLTNAQSSALDLMTSTLQSWGLSSLSSDLKQLIVNGDTSADTLSLALSQTDAYKQRFKANATRVANGLPELSPAQYIATEEQYRNVLQSYGLPKGFYDKQADLDNLIANDVSPTELDKRAQIAAQQYQNAPQAYKDVWEKYYNFTPGDAIASIIDPNHESLQNIQNQANSVAIGATAQQQGLSVSKQRAEQFNANGVTLDQAQKAYQQIAQSLPIDQNIASRFGQTFGQTQEENDLLLGQGQDTALRQQLYSSEENLFKEHSGTNAAGIGVEQEY